VGQSILRQLRESPAALVSLDELNKEGVVQVAKDLLALLLSLLLRLGVYLNNGLLL
jgi:hypothetical protein